MDELAALVGDMAELARGEQPQLTAGPVRLDLDRARGRRRGHHPRAEPRGDLRRPGGAHLGVGLVGPDRAGRGQPARQRPQVEPGRRGGRGGLLAGAPSSCGTTVPGSTTATSATSSTASTGPRAPAAARVPASAWPSWPRWPGTRAGSVNVYRAEGGGAVFRFSLPEVAAADRRD